MAKITYPTWTEAYADSGEFLDRQARSVGLSRLSGETDEKLRERVLEGITGTKPKPAAHPRVRASGVGAPTRTAQPTTGVAPAGVNESGLVECKKSKYHGHHPSDEDCPRCDPPKLTVTYSALEPDPSLVDYIYSYYHYPKGTP